MYFAHMKPGSELSGNYPVNCVDFRNGTQSDRSGFKPANKLLLCPNHPLSQLSTLIQLPARILKGMRGLDPQWQASGVS